MNTDGGVDAQSTIAQLQRQGKEVTQENVQALQAQRKQMENMRADMLANLLTPSAFDRLKRVSLVKPQIARGVEEQILMMAKRRQLRGKVDELQLKQLLDAAGAAKAKTGAVKIQRKRYFDDDDSDDDNDDDL